MAVQNVLVCRVEAGIYVGLFHAADALCLPTDLNLIVNSFEEQKGDSLIAINTRWRSVGGRKATLNISTAPAGTLNEKDVMEAACCSGSPHTLGLFRSRPHLKILQCPRRLALREAALTAGHQGSASNVSIACQSAHLAVPTP